jgi:FtsP/CotA-like multicopper oxidase with cupredoxin domain
MRVDVALRLPSETNQEIRIYDNKGRGYFELCRLITTAPSSPLLSTQLKALPANPLPTLDLENAETLAFEFEWAGALSPVKKGKVDSTFWTINRRAWEGMNASSIPAPLATVGLGKTVIMKLHNATPHGHPIHMHGIIFTVLSSDKQEIDPFQTDTILLERNERATIAFVADNPGRWMFHCHVIEHMKTGLMGYITIA